MTSVKNNIDLFSWNSTLNNKFLKFKIIMIFNLYDDEISKDKWETFVKEWEAMGILYLQITAFDQT